MTDQTSITLLTTIIITSTIADVLSKIVLKWFFLTRTKCKHNLAKFYLQTTNLFNKTIYFCYVYEFPVKVGLHQGSSLKAKPIPVYRSIRCHQRRVQMRVAKRFLEEMAWMADWDGEQGTKSKYREIRSDGQQQERNKSKHQRQPRHEPQTGE